MIEIVLGNGDRTEAETPEQAMLAARTMWDEGDWRGSRPGVTFHVHPDDGEAAATHHVSDRTALDG